MLILGYASLVFLNQSTQKNYTHSETHSKSQTLAVDFNASSNDKSQTSEVYKLQIADHKAQVRMAEYALIGVGLGVAGSLMLFWTLSYTRDAAIAARETLKIAQDTLRLQRLKERPLVDVVDIELGSLRADHFNSYGERRYGMVGSFKFTLENKGTVPAKLIRCDSFSAVMGSGPYQREEFDRQFNERAINAGGTFITPGETKKYPINHIFVEALPPDNSVTTVVVIKVLYTDFVSQQRMETEYKFGIFARQSTEMHEDYENYNGLGINISTLESGVETCISQVACIKMI